MLNISAALLAVPGLYLVYDLARQFSQRRLTRKIFDYVKMLADTQALSIATQLMKILYPYDDVDRSLSGIAMFLSLEAVHVRGLVENGEYLGFQLFKRWDSIEKSLNEIVQNASLIQRLDDEQVIALIALIEGIRRLDALQNTEGLFEVTDQRVSEYRVEAGQPMNPQNCQYPDRYLLLKHREGDQYEVTDFGDFARYRTPLLLNVCRVSRRHLDLYAGALAEVISGINRWLELTGGEFLLDTRIFRLGAPGRGQTGKHT